MLHFAAADLNILDVGSNNGIARIKGKTTFVQKGNFKTTHLINLELFKITLLQIDNVAENLGQDNSFRAILENKIVLLKKSFKNLFPKSLSRTKRSWESLGSGIKWIAGNADADDLRDIYDKFEIIERNQKTLADSNNDQIEINIAFQDKINEISHLISNSITSKFNRTFTSLEMVNLLFNIDLAKEKIENINDAIILAKAKIVSKNILEEKEIELIFNKLREQNLTVSSVTEMFVYLEAQVEYQDEVIKYHVNVPQVENEFVKLHIEPLPLNGKEIKFDHRDLLIKGDKTYAIIEKCLETANNFICKPSQLLDVSDDPCIPLLIRDATGNCIFKVANTRTETKMLGEGAVLVKSISPVKLVNTCGIANHTIIGSILLTFRNCSISINGETFENMEMSNKEKFELLPMFNVKARQRNSELLVDLHELHDLHIKNKQHLELLHLSTKEDKWISWTTFIIISIVVLVIIGISSFFIWKIKIISKTILPSRDEKALGGEKSTTLETPRVQSCFSELSRSHET